MTGLLKKVMHLITIIMNQNRYEIESLKVITIIMNQNSYEIENLHLITIDMSLLLLGRLEYRVDRLCFCGTIRPAKVRISSYE